MTKQTIALFIQIQKQKQLSKKNKLMVYLNHHAALLYQIYKIPLEKVEVGLLINHTSQY